MSLKPIYPKIKGSGSSFPARKTIDFISGSNIEISISDSESTDTTTVNISSSASGLNHGQVMARISLGL